MRARRRALVLFLPLLLLGVLGGKCGGGDGSGGRPPVIRFSNIDPRCLTIAGKFPSGFAMLPGGDGRAAVVQFFPQALLGLDLTGAAPRLETPNPVPILPDDSDGDGTEDGQQTRDAGFRFPLRPVLGRALAVDRDLVLVSASNFEEVIAWVPSTGTLAPISVQNPLAAGAHDPDAYPFLPPPGTTASRTAISTKRCLYPPDPVDSLGDPIPPEPMCDATRPSTFTRLTAGAATAAGRLFVATSNLRSSGDVRFEPGAVLIYELATAGAPFARPDIDVPVVFTTGFNPTELAAHTTPTGRELILVLTSGAIGAGAGSGNIFTDSFIDVIDAGARAIVATIPLGLAGAFNTITIDPSGRIALLGASSQRHVYGVDLAPLDDPALYPPRDPPPRLDGTTPGFPDARIFTASHPFVIPARENGPDPDDCAGLTDVAIDATGAQAYVTDFCDGTLSIIGIDLVAAPGPPLPANRFELLRIEPLLAPLTPESIDELRAPAHVEVRPGRPGVDYDGPDVFLVAGEPEGTICGIRIESPSPSG